MRKIDETAFIADGAKIVGNVVLEKNSSVWFNAVLRAEENRVIIGERSNIQDLCMAHAGRKDSVIVGKNVTVGHLVLLHGCTIGDNTLIGMHSTIMDGAKIGKNCIIGAGSLVTGGTVIPDNSLALGRPARVIRSLTDEEILANEKSAEFYIIESALYSKETGTE